MRACEVMTQHLMASRVVGDVYQQAKPGSCFDYSI